jgi:hypothetical protein
MQHPPEELLVRQRGLVLGDELKTRDLNGQGAGPGEVVQQRSMGLEDAATVRALWRRQRTLERVLEDDEALGRGRLPPG